MRKILVLFLASLMVICFAACDKKSETPANQDKTAQSRENMTSESETSAEDTAASEDEAEPAEYSAEYWEKKYPGENICPFSIEIDGVKYSYYRISSLDEGTMITWINTPLNWNGWHLVGEDIVNKDETYKMTADWTGKEPEQAFSSCCTVTTEKYTPSAEGTTETSAAAAPDSATAAIPS